MDQFEGILSLFIVCMELVLLINLLIFAEKNSVNKPIILLIFLLMLYQVYEFVICYFGINEPLVVYLAFWGITLLPPLGLLVSLRMFHGSKSWHKLVFLPALFFIFYYPTVLTEFEVARCTVLYAVYNYPLGTLYGIFYWLPIGITIILIAHTWYRAEEKLPKHLALVMLASFIVTFVPSGLMFLLSDFMSSIKESILCKIALILALGLTYFALKNKSVFGKE